MRNLQADELLTGPSWTLSIKPSRYDPYRIASVAECQEIVDAKRMVLGDRPFPPPGDVDKTNEGIEASNPEDEPPLWTWRFITSGRFDYTVSLSDEIQATDVLMALSEVFAFGARLAAIGLTDPAVEISFRTRRIRDLRLYVSGVDNAQKTHLLQSYAAPVEAIELNQLFTSHELLTQYRSLALDWTTRVFESFGWDDPSRQRMEYSQLQFLTTGAASPLDVLDGDDLDVDRRAIALPLSA